MTPNPENMLRILDPDLCRELFGRAMKMALTEPNWQRDIKVPLSDFNGQSLTHHPVILVMQSGFALGPGERNTPTRLQIERLFCIVGGPPKRNLKPRVRKKRISALAKLFRRVAGCEHRNSGRPRGYLYFAGNVKREFLSNKR